MTKGLFPGEQCESVKNQGTLIYPHTTLNSIKDLLAIRWLVHTGFFSPCSSYSGSYPMPRVQYWVRFCCSGVFCRVKNNNTTAISNLLHTEFWSRCNTGIKLREGNNKKTCKKLYNLKARDIGKTGRYLKNQSFLYEVTAVTSDISTRQKQFCSSTQMTLPKLLICFSFGRCSPRAAAFTSLNDSSSVPQKMHLIAYCVLKRFK